MNERILINGNVERVGDRLHLSGNPGAGIVAFDPAEVEHHPDGLLVSVGCSATIVEPPAEQTDADAKQAAEAARAEVMSDDPVACMMFTPMPPGALINCRTGKYIGLCWGAFPCP